MNLPEFSIHRPVTVLMGCAVCVLLGAIAFIRIPVDLMPDTEFPTISVSTTYEGVAPEEMEQLAAGVHTLAQALEKEGRSAAISDDLIGRINAVAAHVESLEPAEGSSGFADLKTELATLRRYMVEAFEPRFDTIEDQIKELSVRLTGAEDAMGRELLEEQMRLFNAKMDSAAITLDEIGRMFAPDGRPRIDRAALSAKADELDGTIRKLTAMRDGLRHAAVCPARSHLECPTFRRLLDVAAQKRAKARR